MSAAIYLLGQFRNVDIKMDGDGGIWLSNEHETISLVLTDPQLDRLGAVVNQAQAMRQQTAGTPVSQRDEE